MNQRRNLNPKAVIQPGGPYSQAVLTPASGHLLHISGQVAMRLDGSIPADFSEQAELVWMNLSAVLTEAGMDISHLVKVVTYVTDAASLPQLGPVRMKFLGENRPASTLVVVSALARPEWKIEVEAVALKN
jgi:enamine deaminase RidA (YjgF/YER057c/UK114 family)